MNCWAILCNAFCPSLGIVDNTIGRIEYSVDLSVIGSNRWSFIHWIEFYSKKRSINIFSFTFGLIQIQMEDLNFLFQKKYYFQTTFHLVKLYFYLTIILLLINQILNIFYFLLNKIFFEISFEFPTFSQKIIIYNLKKDL